MMVGVNVEFGLGKPAETLNSTTISANFNTAFRARQEAVYWLCLPRFKQIAFSGKLQQQLVTKHT